MYVRVEGVTQVVISSQVFIHSIIFLQWCTTTKCCPLMSDFNWSYLLINSTIFFDKCSLFWFASVSELRYSSIFNLTFTHFLSLFLSHVLHNHITPAWTFTLFIFFFLRSCCGTNNQRIEPSKSTMDPDVIEIPPPIHHPPRFREQNKASSFHRFKVSFLFLWEFMGGFVWSFFLWWVSPIRSKFWSFWRFWIWVFAFQPWSCVVLVCVCVCVRGSRWLGELL